MEEKYLNRKISLSPIINQYTRYLGLQSSILNLKSTMLDLQHLQTESRNPASARLDELTSVEIVALMNAEDATIAAAVATQSQAIAQAIDAIAARLAVGGR